MKRLWIGVGVLILLLGMGFGMAVLTEKWLDPVCAHLSTAADAAQAETWDGAVALAGEAENRWQQLRSVLAMVSDHTPMEQIDGLFARLRVYGAYRDRVAFSACCEELAKMTRNISQTHEISWENVL